MITVTYESPVNGFCEEMIVVSKNSNGYFVKQLAADNDEVEGVYILKSHIKEGSYKNDKL
jgi:hypothetical protein